MRTQKNGFTLIELLVVIAIIALLLAILMPALSKVKDIAKSLVCQAHVKQYALANGIYASSNDDKMVAVYWVTNIEFWVNAGASHDSAEEVRNSFLSFVWDRDVMQEMLRDLTCPSANRQNIANVEAFPFTYAYNNGGRMWNSTDPMKMSKVKSPAEKISFTDSSDFATNGWMPFSDFTVGINYQLHWDVVGDWYGQIMSYPHHGVVSYRHSEGASVAMVDGHVESRKKEDVWITHADGTHNVGAMAQNWDLFDEQYP